VAHLFVMSEGSTPAATPAASTAAPGVAGTAPADDAIAAARAAEAAAAPPTAPHDTPATPAPAAPARADSPPSAADVPAAAGEARATRGAEGGPAARTIAGRLAKAQLAIDPNADEYRVRLPPSLARADMKLSAVVKMCVSSDGKVTDVKLLKSADPAIDPQIPATLGRWRYRPLMVGGQAVPFCYVQQYEIAAD
jgi:outer membrane biosynthesis protein TonB